MKKIGNIEILKPSCDPTTITDGRGGIYTWLPSEPLLEFNLLFFNPDKIRGNHYHNEFVEYFLVVQGEGTLYTESSDGETIQFQAKTGDCFRVPMGTSHTFHATTEVKAVSMLTKPWSDCKVPIVKNELHL
jgi:mannose-6-phosphate isomerase-like protein (cupin superfamily)